LWHWDENANYRVKMDLDLTGRKVGIGTTFSSSSFSYEGEAMVFFSPVRAVISFLRGYQA
jgi:hypothetical protein